MSNPFEINKYHVTDENKLSCVFAQESEI